MSLKYALETGDLYEACKRLVAMTTTPTDYSKLTAAQLAERIGIAMGWRREDLPNSVVFDDGTHRRQIWTNLLRRPITMGSWSPAESWRDAGELMDLMKDKGWWVQVRSPFSKNDAYCAGATPLDTTGWNGRPDYQALAWSGPRAVAEAVCAALEAEKP